MKSALLEKYKNELTTKSKLFYNNNGISNHTKVQKHKTFLNDILDRLENDKYKISDSIGYEELHGIIDRACNGIKVHKSTFFKSIAVNLFGKTIRQK